MKKILFIRPYLPSYSYVVFPPLGIMYLASAIKKWSENELQIKIIDMNLGRLGLTDIKKQMQNYKPDIVGVSALTHEASVLYRVSRLAKHINPDCRVIVGGPHATIQSQEILIDNNIDLVVIGEGEKTLSELINGICQNDDISLIKGIAYRTNGKVSFTEPREAIGDLDSLPFPAWDLIDIEKYSRATPNMNVLLAEKIYMPIFSSRGCPYNCIYCHNIFGKNYRERSPENILKEIITLHDQYGVKEFHFVDDCFNLNKKRVKDICNGIINEDLKIKIAFPSGLRADILDSELLAILKAAGTYLINFAVETASPRLQKLIEKNMDLEKAGAIIEESEKLGLITKCNFMLGFPTETIAEIQKTIDFAVNSPLTFASFFSVTPYPQTALSELIQKEYPGVGPADYGQHFFSPQPFYSVATGINLREIQKKAYRKFYLSNHRIEKILRLSPRKWFLARHFLRFFKIFYL